MAVEYLQQAAVFLGATVIAVPLFARLGLGSVLGYLAAGVLVGPSLLNLVGNAEQIMHVAEFGVVVMLFLVGLELQPRTLWQMRGPVFGLGGAQVLLSAIAIMLAIMAMGLDWRAALSIGLALALSSTAIVLQSLAERGQSQSFQGQQTFAILLFQDIAVIPILAVLPMLAVSAAATGHDTGHGFAALPGYAQALISLVVIVGIIIGGRFILRPIFRLVASTGIRELFTATALLIVVGIAVLMGLINLSPALGTFIAGVVLADSEYRHELESDLEPFKGLLLGLFFITVGAGIDFGLLAAAPFTIAGLVVALMLGKAAIIYALAWLKGMAPPHRWSLGLSLGQGGEFAFVLLAVITDLQLIPGDVARTVTVVVALSMALTPLVFIINDKVIQPRFTQAESDEEEADDPSAGHGKPVIIAGFGRFGQLAGRMLKANGIAASILDYDADSITTLRKHGLEVYYGDAARHDLLHTAGAEVAKVLVVAIDDPDRSVFITEQAKKHFPHLQVIVRAHDPLHTRDLEQAGADITVCEAEAGGIGLGEATLRALGWGSWRAARAGRRFRKHQAETHRQLREHLDNAECSVSIHRMRVADLDHLLEFDQQEQIEDVDAAWRTGLVPSTLSDYKA